GPVFGVVAVEAVGLDQLPLRVPVIGHRRRSCGGSECRAGKAEDAQTSDGGQKLPGTQSHLTISPEKACSHRKGGSCIDNHLSIRSTSGTRVPPPTAIAGDSPPLFV